MLTRKLEIVALVAAAAAMALLAAGCQTAGSAEPNPDSRGLSVRQDGDPVKVSPILHDVDPNKIATHALLFQAVVTSGVSYGVQKQPKITAYLKAVRDIACSLSEGTDLSPEVLNAALQATSVKEFKTAEAEEIVDGIVLAYGLAYKDRVKYKVDANIYAKPFMQAICKGIRNGLERGKAQGLRTAKRSS